MTGQSTMRGALGVTSALALGAATLAGYLAWVTWNMSPIAGCGEQSLFDCSELLSSKWSKWLGMPVSFLGALTYGLLFGVSLVMSVWVQLRNIAWSWLWLMLLALLAAGAAVWFLMVQAFVLREFCPYCCLIHACGLVICLLVLWKLPRGGREKQQAQMGQMLGFWSVEDDQSASDVAVLIESSHLWMVALLALGGLAAFFYGQWYSADESFLVELSTPNRVTPPNAAIPDVQVKDAATVSSLPASAFPGSLAEVDEQSPEVAMEFVPTENTKSMGALRLEGRSERPFTGAAERSEVPTDEDQQANRKLDSTELVNRKGANQEGAHREPVMISGVLVDVSKLPVLGNPRAEHVMVELLDYTCRHCRKFHHLMESVLHRYGDQIAIGVRPVALSPKCNSYVMKKNKVHAEACKYSRLAIAVWRVNPQKFPEFHNWLMGAEKIPSISAANQRAVQLVGTEVILREIKSHRVRNMLEQNHEIFHKTKRGLPILMTTVGALSGLPKSVEQLYEAFEKNFGFQPVLPTTEPLIGQ